MKETKPTLTIYSVHSDTDAGYDLEMFLDIQKEQDYCNGLVRAKGDLAEIKLLDDGNFEEAWVQFQERESGRQNYYARHENEIEDPVRGNLLEACKMILKWIELENSDNPEIEELTLQTVTEHVQAAIAKADQGEVA